MFVWSYENEWLSDSIKIIDLAEWDTIRVPRSESIWQRLRIYGMNKFYYCEKPTKNVI